MCTMYVVFCVQNQMDSMRPTQKSTFKQAPMNQCTLEQPKLFQQKNNSKHIETETKTKLYKNGIHKLK
jgi:hypothetical protein